MKWISKSTDFTRFFLVSGFPVERWHHKNWSHLLRDQRPDHTKINNYNHKLAHNIILKSSTHLTVCTVFASFSAFREYHTSHIPGGQRSPGHGDPPLLQQKEVTRAFEAIYKPADLLCPHAASDWHDTRYCELQELLITWTDTKMTDQVQRFRHERDGEEEKLLRIYPEW